MKKLLRIITFILIQTVLILDFAYCGQAFLLERNRLSPHIQISAQTFKTGFEGQLKNITGELHALNDIDMPNLLENASRLLTATDIRQVEDIIKVTIQLLGFSRVKFYEITRYDRSTRKWWLRQEIKVGGENGGSDRYIKEGQVEDEKEYILNRAEKTGKDIYHNENRWANLIGDNNAQIQCVNPELIHGDTEELGDGYPQRVKEFLHIVIRNSRGKIVGILSADKWQKPRGDDITQSEPIFFSDEDKQRKIKILRIFAKLGGIAIQRLRFESKKEDIENFQEKEEVLLDILHNLKNKLMEMTYTLLGMESKEKKKRIRGKIIAIENSFRTLVTRLRQWTGSLEMSSALYKEGIINQVLQIIEETADTIQSREIEVISGLFKQWKEQVKMQIRESAGRVTPEHEGLYNFLQDFEKLAIYQAGLFDREETIRLLHKKIQKTWLEIGEEISDLEQEKFRQQDEDKLKIIEGIFDAYEKAKIEYGKYINLLNNLESVTSLNGLISSKPVDIKELVFKIYDNFPADLEKDISAGPYLPKVNIDINIFSSVLNEMMENARKYGGNYLFLEVSLDKEYPGFVRLNITTKGRGIAEDKWKRVFLKEFRVNADDGLGTGLGLDIVKKSVERMGGKIWVSSSRLQNEAEEGMTVFSIILPSAGVEEITRKQPRPKDADESPLLIIDSGAGGLSFLNLIKEAEGFEKENFILFADKKSFPFGFKTVEYLRNNMLEIISAIKEHTKGGLKGLVISSGTASMATADYLRQMLEIPIFDVITASSHTAVKILRQSKYKDKKIGVLATDLAVKSNIFAEKINRLDSDAQIISKAAPELIEAIQDYSPDKYKEVEKMIEREVERFAKEGVKVLILGCTHFSLFRDEFEKKAQGKMIIIDPPECVISELDQYLTQEDLYNKAAGAGYTTLIKTEKNTQQIHVVSLVSEVKTGINEHILTFILTPTTKLDDVNYSLKIEQSI